MRRGVLAALLTLAVALEFEASAVEVHKRTRSHHGDSATAGTLAHQGLRLKRDARAQ